MGKAKKNTPRSGNKQRKHTKQHLTQAELSMQKSRALARRIVQADEQLERVTRATGKPHRIVYLWGVTPAAPTYKIESV